MFIYDQASSDLLTGGGGRRPDVLIWITARNRDTGAAETIGFWSGEDNRTITIGGEPRDYIGAGAVLSVGNITYAQGQDIMRWQFRLASVRPEVRTAFLSYEPRGAGVEAHQLLRAPVSHAFVGTPRRIFLGEIEDVKPVRAAVTEPSDVTFSCASVQREMTRTLSLTKSDEDQSRRQNPLGPDRGRKYAVLTGTRRVSWGEKQR